MDPLTVQAEIAEIIARVPTESARARLADELKILISRWNAASATPEEKQAVESRLAQLRRDAEIAAQVSLWSNFSMVLVGVILFVFFGGIFLYLNGMRPEPYWTIEATRPIIVFTLIVAMLSFGGLLIVRALFSNDDDQRMQIRFRHAREVFLVFSGVFSTVIGFYFGSGTGGAATDPPVLAAASIERSGVLSVAVSQGRAPYEGTIRLVGEEDERRLAAVGGTLSIPLNPRTECPAGARISVRDSESRAVDQTVAQTREQLQAGGWAGCAPAPGDAGNPSVGNSGDSNAIGRADNAI